jgi:hypothetical protein
MTGYKITDTATQNVLSLQNYNQVRMKAVNSTTNSSSTYFFNSDGTIAVSIAGVNVPMVGVYSEKTYGPISSQSGTIAPDITSGTIHNYTLQGNITLNALTNAVTGSSVTLLLKQDSTGSRTMSSSMKWSGAGYKTLTTTSNATDIVNIFYDGTNYYASLIKNFV